MKKRTMIAGFVLAATLTFSMPVSNLEGSFGADVVSAASGSTSTPAPKPTPSKPSSGKSSSKSSSKSTAPKSSSLTIGSRGNDVRSLQIMLNNNGAKLTVDGIYGSKTQAEVKKYQAKKGLTANGIANPITRAMINPVKETVKLGSKGGQVQLVQFELYKKGYTDLYKIDGVFGQKTLTAVKSFQVKNGLKADGIVGKATHAKLHAKPSTPPKTDAVSAASTNVSSIAVLEKSMSKDGKWIIATSKNLSTTKALVLDGTFKHNGKTERNIALYNQDAAGKVTARYSLTAPKLTIKSPNARITNGTFKGDLYVSAENFSLVGAKIDGDVYFTTEKAKSTFKMDSKSSVTGNLPTTPVEDPDDTTGPSENPDPDVVTAASIVDDVKVFEKSIGTEGKWIIATTKDLVSTNNLVLEGDFENGKLNADGTKAIQRKIALYTQDDAKNVTGEFTLTAPKITIKSANARIQNGTFIGDVYVERDNFLLSGTTVKGNVYVNQPNFKLAGDAKIEGNVYFATQAIKDTFIPATGTITGEQIVVTPDVVTAASTNVDKIEVFEKSIGTEGKWIIATTKDLVSTKELVLDGDFENGKLNTDGTKAIQRKIALYTQDDAKNVTGEFTLTAPKITIKSANARIQNGTFIGDVHVDRDNFLLSGTTVKGDVYVNQPNFKLAGDAKIEGNVYFTTQAAKDTFVQATGTITGSKILTQIDAVATASLVRTDSALESAMSANGKWIIGILNDITTTKELVLDGTFTNTKTPPVQMRKIALYSQDAAKVTTRKFTLTAPKLTINSPDANISKGTFVGDVYVSAPNFKLIDAKVEGNIYFTTQEAKDTFTKDATSSVSGAQELKTN